MAGGAFLVCFTALQGVAAGVEAGIATALAPWTGGERQAFVLPAIAGGTLDLAAQRGRPIVLHFFATWCEPCREELPALDRLAARANGALKVIAVVSDDSDVRVRRFFEKAPVNFPVLLDRDQAVTKAWTVSTLPSTIVLDRDLQPKFVVENEFAWDALDPATLDDMLAGAAGKPQHKQDGG